MKKFSLFLYVFCFLLTIMALSGCVDNTTSVDSPFGHIYTIEQVLHTGNLLPEDTDNVLIQLGEHQTLWICTDLQTYDYMTVGKFEAVELEDSEYQNQLKGLWRFYADADQNELYELQVTKEGTIKLSFLETENVQWIYQLRRVDLITCNVTALGALTTIYPDWFFPNTFSATPDNLIYLSGADISGKGTVKLTVQDDAITSLTVYEAYYTNGSVEYNEYTLEKDFKLSVSTRYESGEQFAIYRIPCGEIECWFYLNFN